MSSSKKVLKPSSGLTRKLEIKYQGLVSGEPQRLILWLPGHRTPAHNVLVRANRWRQHSLTEEAQKAVLNARMSSLPSSASGRWTLNQNPPL